MATFQVGQKHRPIRGRYESRCQEQTTAVSFTTTLGLPNTGRIKSLDGFLDRMPRPGYNCLDFVREVWQAMTGLDITDRLTGLQGDFLDRKATKSGYVAFSQLKGPLHPCLVVMQRGKMVPHIGVYINGKIMHMTGRGVQLMPPVVARGYYTKLRYYR